MRHQLLLQGRENDIFSHISAKVISGLFDWAFTIQSSFARVLARRHVRISLMLAILVIASKIVIAQDPGGAIDQNGYTTGQISTIGGEPMMPVANGPNATKIIDFIGESVDGAVAKITGKLNGYGPYLMDFALGIMMLWTAIKTLMAGKGVGDLFAEWVPIWLAFGIATLLVTQGMRNQIEDTMYELAKSIAGTDMKRTSNTISVVLSNVLTSIRDILYMPGMGNLAWSDLITGAALTLVLSLFIVLVGKIVTIFLLLLAGCLFIANMLLAAVSLKLAMALGVIMIPFMIIKPLAWIWEGWLKFTIGAGMMLIVGAFFLDFSSSLTSKMLLFSTQAKADAQGQGLQAVINDFTLYVGLIVIAGVVALLSAQIPSIANGLISGHSSGGGFSGLKAITSAAGAGMAMGALTGMATNSNAAANMASKMGASDVSSGRAPTRQFSSQRMQQAYASAYKNDSPGVDKTNSAYAHGQADRAAGKAGSWKYGNNALDQAYKTGYNPQKPPGNDDKPK